MNTGPAEKLTKSNQMITIPLIHRKTERDWVYELSQASGQHKTRRIIKTSGGENRNHF